jgi:hypothetical protein
VSPSGCSACYYGCAYSCLFSVMCVAVACLDTPPCSVGCIAVLCVCGDYLWNITDISVYLSKSQDRKSSPGHSECEDVASTTPRYLIFCCGFWGLDASFQLEAWLLLYWVCLLILAKPTRMYGNRIEEKPLFIGRSPWSRECKEQINILLTL